MEIDAYFVQNFIDTNHTTCVISFASSILCYFGVTVYYVLWRWKVLMYSSKIDSSISNQYTCRPCMISCQCLD